MKRLKFLLIAATAIMPVMAADIYVHPERGRKGGTKEQPFKYLADALAKAVPGDVIHLAGGIYNG